MIPLDGEAFLHSQIKGSPGFLIAFSFFIGALISCLLFLSSAYFLERISYFFSYVSDIFSKKQIYPYMKSGNRPEHFHFTVPIFLATLLLIGGFCL